MQKLKTHQFYEARKAIEAWKDVPERSKTMMTMNALLLLHYCDFPNSPAA